MAALWAAAVVAAAGAAPAGPAPLDARAPARPAPLLAHTAAFTEPITYTLLLPSVARYWRDGPPTPFGLQVYGTSPPIVGRLAEAGGDWARIELRWAAIEPENATPAGYAWDAGFEQGLASLAAAGYQVILLVMDNPAWAATYPAGPVDRVDASEFVEFLTAAAERYGGPPYYVHYWELYNEPDNGDVLHAEAGWGYFGHTPELYTALLRSVYGPLKAADPLAQVVFGGLAYDRFDDDPLHPGPFVHSFLDGVLEGGGGAYFDVMNFHYYPVFRANWEPYGTDIIGKAAYLRAKLAGYGVDKPFICTEVGQSSGTGGSGEELQSRYVVQALARGMAGGLLHTIWYQLVDSGADREGLVRVDLSRKPAFFAYQTLVEQLAWATYTRALGAADTGSAAIEAYQFSTPDRTTILAAWTVDELDHELVLSAAQAVVVDKMGGETVVTDEQDGQADGRVRVSLGPSPVFVRYGGSSKQQAASSKQQEASSK